MLYTIAQSTTDTRDELIDELADAGQATLDAEFATVEDLLQRCLIHIDKKADNDLLSRFSIEGLTR